MLMAGKEYSAEDKLHRLVDILPQSVYHQLSTIMPLEKWKYEGLKAKVVDMINLAYRFVSQEALRHGNGPSLFKVNKEEKCQNGCGEACECPGGKWR